MFSIMLQWLLSCLLHTWSVTSLKFDNFVFHSVVLATQIVRMLMDTQSNLKVALYVNTYTDSCVLCHCAGIAKNFRCCTTDCLFCKCDWRREISLQKVININEA